MQRVEFSSLKRTLLAIIAIAVLTVALRVPLLNVPFERDEGEYAYISWRLGFNEIPYRDWFDQKPPGIFAAYRLASELPMEPVAAVHFTAMLFTLAAAICLFFLARKVMKDSWALVSALLFVALSADPFAQGTSANTEVFMALPTILANFLFLLHAREGRGGKGFIFLLGVANGIAMVFKQVALLNWVFLLAMYPFAASGNREVRKIVPFVLWSAIGVAAVWGVAALYFWQNNALKDFIYNVFLHNFAYVQAITLPQRIGNLLFTLPTLLKAEVIIWAAAVAGLVVSFRQRERWVVAFTGGWLISALIGVSASGYYFAHYFQQMFPPLAMLAAMGIESLRRSDLMGSMPSAAKSTACGAIFAFLPALTYYPFIFKYTPSEASAKIYPGEKFGEMREAARFLARYTKENDRVFVFGAAPELLFYAKRASATRYIFLFPLYGPYRDAMAKQMKTAAEVAAANPAAVVLRPNALFFNPGTEQYLTNWTRALVATQYKVLPEAYGNQLLSSIMVRKDIP